MALSPKERGPRVSVMCVQCGKSAHLKRIEVAVFGHGVKQAIYECDCGGVVKRIVRSSLSDLDELVRPR
jgi:hypothetical protein